jgi:hypothetical protein
LVVRVLLARLSFAHTQTNMVLGRGIEPLFPP